MATKKYVSLNKLSSFLDNLKTVFAFKAHTHSTSDISDYTIDSALSSTSTNPVQNKVIDAEFDAIADGMSALELAIDGKADATHNHAISDVTDLQTTLDGKLSSSGDIMTGAITLTQANLVKRDKDTSSVSIYGGTESGNGATITAYGKEQAIYAGRFALKANNGESSATLEGIPDGTLRWNGKNVVTLGTSEVIPVSSGGTGAANASDALSNLGGAPKTNPTLTGSFSMNKLYSSTTGSCSFVEGYNGSAAGNYGAHSEGYYTEANGDRSHAEGDGSVANGVGAHAEGQKTIASCDYSHVQGKYNIEDTTDTYAHIVGNGEGNASRSNAHTIDWDGNAWFAGDVYVGGTSQDDTAASKVITGADIDGIVYANDNETNEAVTATINADTLGGVLPENYALKTDIPEFDDTLSIENCIADAKVVGDALATKAITGYGYDGTPIGLHEGLIASEAELDAALEVVYSEMGTCETKLVRFQGYPDESDYNWFGILRKSSNNYGSLLAQSAYAQGTLISKTKYDGVWQPLEWVNPRMLVGVEYRTTERWNGKPIYTKMVEFAGVPDSSTKSVNSGINASSNLIVGSSFMLINSTGLYLRAHTPSTFDYVFVASEGQTNFDIRIVTTAGGYSTYTGYFTIKYVRR